MPAHAGLPRLVWITIALLPGHTAGFFVCYAFFGPVNDLGWTYSHNLARAWADEELGTTSQYEESVFFRPPDEQRRIVDRFVIQDRCDLVVFGSDMFNDLALEYARNYPGVKFVCIAGRNQDQPNLAGAYIRLYQGFYIAGIVAAMQPGVSKLGYVGSMYAGDSLRNVNAFAMGARSVNPNITVFLIHVGSWFSPREERIAGVRLFRQYGVDLVTYDSDSTALCALAKEEGRYSIAVKTDCTTLYGESNLMSSIFIWTSIFVDFVSAAMKGTSWNTSRNDNSFVGMEKDAISLGTFSSAVGAASRLAARRLRSEFSAGQDSVWCPVGGSFRGVCPPDAAIPMGSLGGLAQNAIWPCDAGPARTPQIGPCLAVAQLRGMAWLLEGVTDLGLLQVPAECPAGSRVDPLAQALCVPCAAGSFQDMVDQTGCVSCLPGSYSGTPSSVRCSVCPAGSYSGQSGATGCAPCELGFFSSGGALLCSPCPAGSYRDSSSGACQRCPQGTFANESGSSACALCGRGLFSDGGAALCTPCPLGTFRDAVGGIGILSCDRCPVGKYTGMEGSPTCTPCAGALTTEHIASMNETACVCPAGTYQPSGSGGCVGCPTGMDCPRGSRELHFGAGADHRHPLLRPSYWSAPASPLSVLMCESAKRCPGGDPGSCGPRLQGASCAHCEAQHFWSGEQCTRCTSFETSSVLFPTLPLVFGPLVVVAMYRFFRDPASRWGSWQNCISAYVFVLLTHYQVLHLILSTDVELPGSLADSLSFWSFTNDIQGLLKASCIGMSGVTSTLPINCLGPLIVLLIVAITFLASWPVAWASGMPGLALERNRTVNIFLSIVFTFFNTISDTALQLFKCFENPNGERTLAVDRSVVCYHSRVWQDMILVGAAAFLVYCMGGVALFARAIWVAPSRFQHEGFQKRWKFLFIKYRPDVWWFALAFLGRCILLNLGFVVVTAAIAQLLWVFTVGVLYMSLVIAVEPYRSLHANNLELVAGFSILYTAAISTWWADRARGEYDSGLAITGAAVGFLPLLLGACAILSKVCTGFGLKHTMACERSAKELSALLKEAALIPESEIVEALHSAGWHDRQQILGFINIASGTFTEIGFSKPRLDLGHHSMPHCAPKTKTQSAPETNEQEDAMWHTPSHFNIQVADKLKGQAVSKPHQVFTMALSSSSLSEGALGVTSRNVVGLHMLKPRFVNHVREQRI